MNQALYAHMNNKRKKEIQKRKMHPKAQADNKLSLSLHKDQKYA
jgi:hypothetical protein